MEYLRVTSLVGAWEPARVGTSQYRKSHKTVPTIQINYFIVEHVKKKNCAPIREKPRILEQLPFRLTRVYCDELPEQKCTLKRG